jgi:hypothetical protein
LTKPQVKEAAGAEERERVYVTASEVMDLSGSKGTANFVMKFAKGCKDVTMNVQAVKKFTREYTGAAWLGAAQPVAMHAKQPW